MQLGRYSVLHALGAGAMGIVYAAYDPELDRRVALKLLHGTGADSSKLSARLLREAQAMARLSHPNVIAVHDVGTVGEQVFIAMELVDGETLAKWMQAKDKPRGWQETLRLFILAGRGLAAAHAAQVVHRDFKPDNVLVGKDGSVRVTDFGLARTAAQRGDTVGARADQFSFCVALYEALYGERPFAGENLAALSAEIAEGRVRNEPDGARVPARIRRALLRGMSARAEDRFPTLTQLLDLLALDPAVRRKKVAIAAGLIALALVAVVLARWEATRNARLCQGAGEKLAHGLESSRAREGERRVHRDQARLRQQRLVARGARARCLREILDGDAHRRLRGDRDPRRAVGGAARPAHGLPRRAPRGRERGGQLVRCGRREGGRPRGRRGGGIEIARPLRGHGRAARGDLAAAGAEGRRRGSARRPRAARRFDQRGQAAPSARHRAERGGREGRLRAAGRGDAVRPRARRGAQRRHQDRADAVRERGGGGALGEGGQLARQLLGGADRHLPRALADRSRRRGGGAGEGSRLAAP